MRDRESEAMEQTNIIYFVLTQLSSSRSRRSWHFLHFNNHYAYTDFVVVIVVIAQKTDVSSCTPCVHIYSTEFSVYVQHLHRIGRCFDSLSTHTHTPSDAHTIIFVFPIRLSGIRERRLCLCLYMIFFIWCHSVVAFCLLSYTHIFPSCVVIPYGRCALANAMQCCLFRLFSIQYERSCGRCTLHTACINISLYK